MIAQHTDPLPNGPRAGAVRYDHVRVLVGLGFLLMSLILPKLIQPQMNLLIADLQRSIMDSNIGLLLFAANKLVGFNTLRHSPVFLGTFLFGEGLVAKFEGKRLLFCLTLLLIPLVFRSISVIYGIEFVVTFSGYLTMILTLVLQWLTAEVRPVLIKLIIILFFLFGFDWLDMVPLLAGLGFGRGDVARTIRLISGVINADYIMNFVGLTISLLCITTALILTKVVVDYYKKMSLADKLRRIELEALRSRYFQDVKHLVHDLKTPLVAIQGLSEVISLRVDDPNIQDYTNKISQSAERISSMINEILHETMLRPTTVQEIVSFLQVHLTLEELTARVRIEHATDESIYANKYLFSRALINVIDNGLQAADGPDGEVRVEVTEENGQIVFRIRDNGRGIPRDSLDRIWELGYSGRQSTGLGLNFVKKVVDGHGGRIHVASRVGVGTTVTISVPEVKVADEEGLGG